MRNVSGAQWRRKNGFVCNQCKGYLVIFFLGMMRMVNDYIHKWNERFIHRESSSGIKFEMH